MEKTDFFTREVDERVLSGECDIGIHSAKDLPEPLPKELKIFALTKGEVSTDSLKRLTIGRKEEFFIRGSILNILERMSPISLVVNFLVG